jgi:hypothetical protein
VLCRPAREARDLPEWRGLIERVARSRLVVECDNFGRDTYLQLARVVTQTHALYGSLEGELPTPAQLATGAAIGSSLFVSTTLTDADPHLLADLRRLRPRDEETTWPHGRLFRLGPLRTDDGSTYDHDQNTATGRRRA